MSLAEGLRAHRAEYQPAFVVAMEPASWAGLALLRRLGVEIVESDQFLCPRNEFAAWASERKQLTMEAFYRWQRRRLGYLMDGDQLLGGRWIFDHDNRQPPPRPHAWSERLRSAHDEVDRAVLADLRNDEAIQLWGEDAMVSTDWHLAHTLLSPTSTSVCSRRPRCASRYSGIHSQCLLGGLRPSELVEWMWAGFVDGAEWVMVPNVIGMALYADGGRMATKPYASGGAYIDRMSDYCKACRFDRAERVGPDACPFTTLYWSFSKPHRERFARNPRIAQHCAGLIASGISTRSGPALTRFSARWTPARCEAIGPGQIAPADHLDGGNASHSSAVNEI